MLFVVVYFKTTLVRSFFEGHRQKVLYSKKVKI